MTPKSLVTLFSLTLTVTACSDSQGVSLPDPSSAKSADFALEPTGGAKGYQSGSIWQDSTTLEVQLDHQPVPGAVVRYRATAGDITPSVDTSGSDGSTFYVWRADVSGPFNGEVYGCVEGKDGCVEKRLVGFHFTPGGDDVP